jgi:hypothetical protein
VPFLRGYGTTRLLSSNTVPNAQQSVVAVDTIALMDALVPHQATFASFGLIHHSPVTPNTPRPMPNRRCDPRAGRHRHVRVAQFASSVSGRGTYQVKSDRFAKHEAVSFGRSKRHLASVPRFIGRWLANLGPGCHCSCVLGIDRIDREVRDVAMVAQVGSR